MIVGDKTFAQAGIDFPRRVIEDKKRFSNSLVHTGVWLGPGTSQLKLKGSEAELLSMSKITVFSRSTVVELGSIDWGAISSAQPRKTRTVTSNISTPHKEGRCIG